MHVNIVNVLAVCAIVFGYNTHTINMVDETNIVNPIDHTYKPIDMIIPYDPCMLYMVTFTINIPQMLAYIPAPWILWVWL